MLFKCLHTYLHYVLTFLQPDITIIHLFDNINGIQYLRLLLQVFSSIQEQEYHLAIGPSLYHCTTAHTIQRACDMFISINGTISNSAV